MKLYRIHKNINFLIFILFLINTVHTQCPDKAFPKVFGGVHRDLQFFQMDYNLPTNKFAVTAYTGEDDLTHSPCPWGYPISLIIMYSATTYLREWVKGVNNCQCVFKHIAFSTDGQYVIAQNENYIISIFSNTGTYIKSTKVYNKAGLSQFTRGLLMDSQATRSIYSIEYYKQWIDGGDKYGFRFFKYPLDTPVTAPTYYKYSMYYDNYDRPYSIAFGAGEDIVYLFAKYSYYNRIIVSRVLSSDLSLIWSYGFLYSQNQYEHQAFDLKNLGSGKEVIAIAVGTVTGTTQYGRLIIQDGIVISSDLFTEPTQYNHAMRGLRVINEETVVACTFDSTIGVYIETLTFGTTLTQSIQKTIPKLTSTFNAGRFISDTNYIGIGEGKDIYLTYGSPLINSFASTTLQGILYSTQPSLTCQTFSTEAPVVRTLTKIKDGIVDWTNTYQTFMTTTLTIQLDTDTATAVTITTTKLVSNDNFCSTLKYVSNATSASAVPVYQFTAGSSKVMTITPLEVLSQCSTDVVSVTYTMTNSDFVVLNSIFTFDATAMTVTASASAARATYSTALKATVVGSTSDYFIQYLNFQGINSAPKLVGAPGGYLPCGFNMPLNSVKTNTIPYPILDDEGNTPITISSKIYWTYDNGGISRFINTAIVDGYAVHTFTPVLFKEVQTYLIEFSITDQYGSSGYSYWFDVTNKAPTFNSALVDQTLAINKVITYVLPGYSDNEGHTATVTAAFLSDGITATPSFIALDQTTNAFTISPTLMSSVGSVTVQVLIFDGQPATTKYSFKVTVTNTVPVFIPATLINQSVQLYYSIDYTPGVYDAEGNTIVYQTGLLPSYITFTDGKFTISPTQISEIETRTVLIEIGDTLLNSPTNSFILTVLPNLPPVFSVSSLPDLTVALKSQLQQTFPTYSDPEGRVVTLTIDPSNLAFLSLVGNDLTITPTLFSETGVYTITVNLNDGKLSSPYPFTLTITNSAPVLNVATISQSIALNKVVDYSLSGFIDAEGHTITMTSVERSTGTLPTFISFVQPTFKFSPTQFSEVGPHIIDIVLSDGQLSSPTYTFTLTVTNSAPILNDATIDQTIALNSIISYALTGFTDAEGHSITMTAVKRSTSSLPSFIVFTQPTFKISPNQFTETGEHIIDVVLFDGQLSSPTYSFKVTVTNSAPLFNILPASQTLALNQKISYTLSNYADAEGHPITITAVKSATTSLPTFISFIQPTFVFSPNQFIETGSHTINIVLNDGQLDSIMYSMIVTVTNSVPYFSKTPVSQTLAMNQIITYKLTDFADAEGHLVTISAVEQGKLKLPAFITFSQPNFTLSPNLFTQIGTSVIDIKLTDGQLFQTYSIDVTVTNSAPKFDSTLPSTQVLPMNSILNYVLPAYSDAEGNPITIKIISGPSFASVQSGGIIKFAPISFADVMTHNIDIVMQDGQPLISPAYSFTITITNTPPIFTSDVIADQNVQFNSIFNYSLPAYHDPEGNPVTITISPNKSFVKVSTNKLILIFNPVNFVDVGTHYLKLTLSDGQPLSTDYQFKVTFPNVSPLFVDLKPQHQVVRLNEDFLYKLPLYKDPEGMDAYVNITTKATFITLIDTDVIKINPTEFSFLGVHSVNISLYDGEPKTSYYEILITVTNTPPKFMGALPQDLELHFNEVIEYDLPAFSDLENNVVTIENTLPPFVEFKENRYYIAPTALSHIGTFQVSGALKDKVSQTLFTFNIKVINEAPYFTSDPIDQTVQVGQSITYQLPSTGDKENLPVKVSLGLIGQKPLPNFMTYADNILTVSPTNNIFHGGIFTLQASLTDGQSTPKFYLFKLKSIRISNDKGSDAPVVKTSSQKSTLDFLSSMAKAQDGSTQKVEIFKATIKLAQATRDGLIKIQISSNKDVSGIVKNIESSDIQFRLITQGKIIVNNTIRSKESSLGYFKAFLKFEFPSEISSSNDPDRIEMTLLNDVIFQIGQTIMILPAQQISRIFLPPQLSECNQNPKSQFLVASAKLAEKFKSGTNIAAVMALPGGLLINLTLSMCIQYLWGMLNDLSFLTILTMISMTLPGIVQMIQQAMLNFIYLDLLMTDQWLVPIFFSEQNEADVGTPLNQQFDENGFSSTILIKNLGSTFVYLLILIGSYPLYYLIVFVAKFSPRMEKYRDKLAENLFWNTPIRFIIQQFPPLFLASLVNLYGISFQTLGTTISSSMAIFIIGASPIVIIIIAGVIYRGRTTSVTDDYNKKFSTISEGLNPKAGFIGAYWNIIVLIRWALTSIVMVSFRDFPPFQIVSMLVMSILSQLLILGGHPMRGQGENKMSFLNEFMVSIYLYITLSLTDLMGPNEFRDICGWALAGVVALSTILNLLKFKFVVIKISIKTCKIRSFKKAVAKKYQIQQQIEQAKIKQNQELKLEEIEKAKQLKQQQDKEHLEFLHNQNYYGSTHKTFIERSKAFQENNNNIAINQERSELMNNRRVKDKNKIMLMKREIIENIKEFPDSMLTTNNDDQSKSIINDDFFADVKEKQSKIPAKFTAQTVKYPIQDQLKMFYTKDC